MSTSFVSPTLTIGLLALCGLGASAVVWVDDFTARLLLACLLAAGMAAVGALVQLFRGSMEADVPRFARRPVATEGFVQAAWAYLRRRAVRPGSYLAAVAVVWTVGGSVVLVRSPPPVEPLLGLALATGLAAAFQWRRLEREVALRRRLGRLEERPLEERLCALPELVKALPRDVTAALIGYRVEKEVGSEEQE